MTKPAVDFVPMTDPLLRHPHLTHSATLVVLGIEIRVETNSEYVRDLVEESFGAWSRSSGPAAAFARRASAAKKAGHYFSVCRYASTLCMSASVYLPSCST
jgi:hypothetical protein